MKSWGIIIFSLIGFLVGMILAGVGGLFAKTTPHVISKSENNVEFYWNDSAISTKELFELVSNSNCQTSEKYFLACVNSIVQIAPKVHLQLSAQTGKLDVSEMARIQDGKTEKDHLQPFVQMFQRQDNALINFESAWQQILKIAGPSEFQTTAIGAGINGFLSVYKDPHTYIMPTKYYEEISSNLDRSNLFVGISFERKDDGIFVRKIFKDSDAAASGLKEQDELVSLNGNFAKNLLLADVSTILRAADTKQFDLKVKRKEEILSFSIKRSFKVIKHVIAERKSGLRDYSLITLSKFNTGVCAEVANRIKELSMNPIAGMVLDLRDNPGGQLDEASCLAGLFIGINKKIYSVKYFDPLKSDEVVLTSGSLLYTGPLVVLVNSSSASASELLAGALQDYNRAIIVGERTFGKGTFQEPETWIKNSKISLFKTQGFYLLPNGESPQLKGILPDFVQVEPHLEVREEMNYFNPIMSQSYLDSLPTVKTKNYSGELEKCLPTMDANEDDLVLKKGLDVLACHRISSLMATQFSNDDLNQ